VVPNPCRLAEIEAVEGAEGYEVAKHEVVRTIREQDQLEIEMATEFRPEMVDRVRAAYAVATKAADHAIGFTKVAKQRMVEGAAARRRARARLRRALDTAELREARRLLPIAEGRHAAALAETEEAQAACAAVNREMRRLQQAAMWAADAVAVAERHEAAAERTTRETAVRFTQELAEKQRAAAEAREASAAALEEARRRHAPLPALAGEARAALGKARTVAARRSARSGEQLEAARRALAEKEVAARREEVRARVEVVDQLRPWGSLLLAIVQPPSSSRAEGGRYQQQLLGAARTLMAEAGAAGAAGGEGGGQQWAEATLRLGEALAAASHGGEQVEALRLRSDCYRAMQCLADAAADRREAATLEADAAAADTRLVEAVLALPGDDADAEGEGGVVAVVPTAAAAATPAAADPCLEAYVALAVGALFEGLARAGTARSLRRALLRLVRPCAEACHVRRPHDWVTLADGRRVRWLRATQHACHAALASSAARDRLLRDVGVLRGSCSHIEVFAFVVSVCAVLRDKQQQPPPSSPPPPPEESPEPPQPGAASTPSSMGVPSSPSAVPSLSKEDLVIGRWVFRLLLRHPGAAVPLHTAWAPKFLPSACLATLSWAIAQGRGRGGGGGDHGAIVNPGARIICSPHHLELAAAVPMMVWAVHESPLLLEQLVRDELLLRACCDAISQRPEAFSGLHVLTLFNAVAASNQPALVVELLHCGALRVTCALLRSAAASSSPSSPSPSSSSSDHGAGGGDNPGATGEGDTGAAATAAAAAATATPPPLARLAALFLQHVASTEASRLLLVGEAQMVESLQQLLPCLVAAAATDAPTSRACVEVAQLLISRELQALAELERADEAALAAAAAEVERMAQRKANLADLAVAGGRLEERARRSFLATVANDSQSRRGASFLAIERAEAAVSQQQATAAAVRSSLEALREREAGFEAAHHARTAALHRRGRCAAAVLSACHPALSRMSRRTATTTAAAAGASSSSSSSAAETSRRAARLLAAGDAYLERRARYVESEAHAGRWAELFWGLRARDGKLRADAMGVLVELAGALADPALPQVVTAREAVAAAAADAAAHQSSQRGRHVDHAISCRLLGYLCQLASFQSDEQQVSSARDVWGRPVDFCGPCLC
jgi:hypothetical protein